MLGGIFSVGCTRVSRDGYNFKPLLGNGLHVFIQLSVLDVTGRGIVAHIDRNKGGPLDKLAKENFLGFPGSMGLDFELKIRLFS